MQAASGIVLLAAATAALVWANSPAAPLYDAIWKAVLGVNLGPFSFERDLHWWVNDGLMTLFFFVVGLEIRREMHAGELSDLRRAALPLAAAVGGMLVPAAIYALFNAGHATSAGWGVPMATDIAFAVGVLALLGDRVPPALRILLLALAVIDDLGAIVVIALFYSDGVNLAALGLAGVGLAGIVGLQLFGVRAVAAYVPLALVAWGATYTSGVSPTVAGVLIGLLAPVGRAEHALSGWVAWFVMPLFAFANAGVSLGSLSFAGDGWRVFVGITAGLVVGKALGVFAAARAATAIGFAALPRGVRWSDVTVVGGVAGIGFTMALFVAQLAFVPGPTLETAKLAILAASVIAGVGGYLLGRSVLGTERRPEAAQTAAEAEG